MDCSPPCSSVHGIHQTSDFGEPRLLHLPIQRKTPNFVTWDIWFSLINSDILMFWLPVLWLQKILYMLVPPFLLQNNSGITVIWDAVSCGSSPQKIHWVKHNSQLLGCAFLFFFLLTISRAECYTTVPSHFIQSLCTDTWSHWSSLF